MVTGKNSSQNPNPAEIYEQFYVSAAFRHWTPILLEFALPKPGEHLLDLACGTGIVARNAARQVGPEGRVVGLDINPAMLEVARRQAGPEASFIEWQEGNAENIPFPDHTFDLVLCQAGLMLFKNRAAAVVELFRVLKEGGRAVVLVWQSLDRQPFNRALCESISRRMGVDIAVITPSFSLGSADALSSLLSEAGFPKVSVYPVQYYIFADDPEGYVDLTLRGAAAANPIFATLDDKTRTELVEGIAADIEPVLQKYLQGGRLIYPVSANIAVAHK
jgi:ubiquinone/menaquinone biosynthesis C-methylase UbiE